MLKVITIVGARPQFIKAAVVSRAFKKYSQNIKEVIIHTGQHYDKNMSDIFFEELDIPKPDYNLGIGGGSHAQNTGQMLENIESILLKEKPDYLLVYGDTDSTLAGALAAAKLHIPVAHVEAGLRSFNKQMPEELNRILTDHISSLLFTPTDTATMNLLKENIVGNKVQQVGDVMYDAALYYSKKAQQPRFFDKKINDFTLATIHRAENTDNTYRLTSIISALNKIAEKAPVVLPLHPRTRKILADGEYEMNNITIVEPVSYLEMIWLLKHCKTTITDSGGLQKESFFFKKPCIITRDETEWVELTDNKFNALAGSGYSSILDIYKNFEFNRNYEMNLFGNADAANHILSGLLK